MQLQVQILTECPYCAGEAYLPDRAETGDHGQQRIIYKPCPDCLGSGHQKIWIELSDLLEMLAEYQTRGPLEPDWQALGRERRISAFAEGCISSSLTALSVM